MSRMLRLVVSLLLLTVVLGLVSTRAASAAQQVPFAGRFTTTAVAATPCGPLTFCLSAQGVGKATHLGRAGMTRSIVATNTLVPCSDVAGGTTRQFTDTMTLHAANGDSITLQGSGTSCANGID